MWQRIADLFASPGAGRLRGPVCSIWRQPVLGSSVCCGISNDGCERLAGWCAAIGRRVRAPTRMDRNALPGSLRRGLMGAAIVVSMALDSAPLMAPPPLPSSGLPSCGRPPDLLRWRSPRHSSLPDRSGARFPRVARRGLAPGLHPSPPDRTTGASVWCADPRAARIRAVHHGPTGSGDARWLREQSGS